MPSSQLVKVPRARRAVRAATLLAACALPAARAGAQAPAPSPAPSATPDSVSYREPQRPQYHFSPAANWMNDPNGMVHHAGEWHLFYQYNPFGTRWGHMHWGHAVSRDLVRWRHLPVAIPEVGDVAAFSGSAVIDHANTSGFARPGGAPPMVAIYTGHREKVGDRPAHQAQYLAYSTDRGRTWTRANGGRPVLDVNSPDFRDPKVFWDAPRRRWVMVVSMAAEQRIRLYASPDLQAWTPLSDFGPAGATSGVWECPDLFPLPVDGDSTRTKWVLVVNMNPGSIAGGSGVQYFVGDFDGTRFVADVPTNPAGANAPAAAPERGVWADHGRDFYAAVTWSDVPRRDGRRIWIGWMNNWEYAQEIPTHPWRSAQSLPRTLGLTTTPVGLRLTQQPVAELRALRGRATTVGAMAIPAGDVPLAARGVRGAALELEATFAVDTSAGAAEEVGLRVRTGANGERTSIGVRPRDGTLVVDRTASGASGFHPRFAGRQVAPLQVTNGRVTLRVFVDWSSVEVFTADGRTVVTDQIFPSPASDGVSLYAVGGAARLVSLRAWPMRSAWPAGAVAVPRVQPTAVDGAR